MEGDEDYENEGHVYGQDDQGGMFVSNTETTYELEGMSESTYDPSSPTDHTIQQVYMPSPTREDAGSSSGIMGIIPNQDSHHKS